MKQSLLCLGGIVVTGIALAAFAFNVKPLWAIWLITVGFFGGSTWQRKKPRSPMIVCYVLLAIIVVSIVSRRLPIHSLDWHNADRVEIAPVTREWTIVLTDPDEVAAFTKFGEYGHYETMILSGYGYHVYVTRNGASTGHYIHGNAFGPFPGRQIQSVFVPRRTGFLPYFEGLLQEQGRTKTVK